MIFISIITLIAAKALPLFKKISSIHISRIASIIFIYTGASSYNCFYIQSIGSGIGIYSGLLTVFKLKAPKGKTPSMPFSLVVAFFISIVLVYYFWILLESPFSFSSSLYIYQCGF